MKYELDRAADKAGEPSIEEMTEKAIKILQKNPKGYFLLVEGIYQSWHYYLPATYIACLLYHLSAFQQRISRGCQWTAYSRDWGRGVTRRIVHEEALPRGLNPFLSIYHFLQKR